ncbi:hypothetical protein D0T84_20885 [Dysgonomonas sp. 521]|nr:hypothetical protein [Dysgonomonas sp. 521]
MNFAYAQQNKRTETVSQCHLYLIPKSAFFYRFLCGMKAKMQVRIQEKLSVCLLGDKHADRQMCKCSSNQKQIPE